MNSPLIQDGALSLTSNGLLQDAPDIKTQMTVTVSAYNCIYNPNLQSDLIPFLTGIPIGGWNRIAIVNIVVAAFTLIMIPQGLINNLQVSVVQLTLNTILIKISALDLEGNNVSLNWTNSQFQIG